MNAINGWKSKVKQWDKLELLIRISTITLLGVYVDITSKRYKFTLLNFGIKN